MYYANKMLEIESAQREGKNLWKEFFFVRRNRRAAQSSFFVMFMQQVRMIYELWLLIHILTDFAVLWRQRHRLLQHSGRSIRGFGGVERPFD